MKFNEELKKIVGLIICLAMVVGGLLIPVEAKASPTWDIKIYEHTDGNVYYLLQGEPEPGHLLNDGDSFELLANKWVLVIISSKLLGFDDEPQLSAYNIGNEMPVLNNYYNKYSCKVSITVSKNTSGQYTFMFNPIISSPTESAVSVSDGSSAPAAPHVHSWTHCTIYEPTEESDGLEGDKCDCGAMKNTSVIPATVAVIENRYQQIDAAKPGKDTILEMKNNCNFSQAFMKKLASKNDCSFVIRFTYKHKNYEVYIPAGTVIDTSLEWYGPEKMMQMFEWKQLN